MKAFLIISTLIIHNSCYGQNIPSAPMVQNGDTIYSFVQQMPEFKGGDVALMSFITKNIEAPATTEGEWCSRFSVRFVIDTDGSVINPIITKSCEDNWNAVLLSLVKKLPKFKPGYQNGKPVKVYFNLPISCILPNK